MVLPELEQNIFAIPEFKFEPVHVQLSSFEFEIPQLEPLIDDQNVFINESLNLLEEYIQQNKSYSFLFWIKSDSIQVSLIKELIKNIKTEKLMSPSQIMNTLNEISACSNNSLTELIQKLDLKLESSSLRPENPV